jgi:2-polyprenyl-6-hydroxyphenyl methylase/3-demethylubiquinone-9 3-methyltransferase
LPEPRFEFGRNWRSYADLVADPQIEEAKRGLVGLIGQEELRGKSFLDIGSGSGLHALAALELGAASVCAMDIDADSVATTQAMLGRRAERGRYTVIQQDILEAFPERLSLFDVVYSWGVLHHTGRMRAAIAQASRLVAPGGLFAFALYRKTWCCAMWTAEKRWYVRASEPARRRARGLYKLAYRAGLTLTGRSYPAYVRAYRSKRGMDFEHDVHDWLGGYPYESASPAQVDGLMASLGFAAVSRNVRADLFSRSGILGAGCDEYVFRRPRADG